MIALENISGELVLRYLDYPSYFDLLSLDIPSTKDGILQQLLTEKLIVKDEAGAYNITNLEYLTNASLRERFQIDVKNSSMISRLLKDACKSGLIKMVDETVGAKNRRYLPYWA